MKVLKKIILLILILLLIFVIFMFIASFSYKNIYYNTEDDSAIIINKKEYKHTKRNKEISGKIEVEKNIIVLTSKDNTKATAIYKSKDNIMRITGEIGNNCYNNGKFKQIHSIIEYFKAIF